VVTIEAIAVNLALILGLVAAVEGAAQGIPRSEATDRAGIYTGGPMINLEQEYRIKLLF